MFKKSFTKNIFAVIKLTTLLFVLSMFTIPVNAQTKTIDTMVGVWGLSTEGKNFQITFTKSSGNNTALKGKYYDDSKNEKYLENIFFVTRGGKSYIRFQITDYGYFDLEVKTNIRCEGTVLAFSNGQKIKAIMTK